MQGASTFGEERGDRGGELGRGDRAYVTARDSDEPSIGYQRGQLVGIRALILVADGDKRRDCDLAQRLLGRRNERVQHVQQRLGVGTEA